MICYRKQVSLSFTSVNLSFTSSFFFRSAVCVNLYYMGNTYTTIIGKKKGVNYLLWENKLIYLLPLPFPVTLLCGNTIYIDLINILLTSYSLPSKFVFMVLPHNSAIGKRKR